LLGLRDNRVASTAAKTIWRFGNDAEKTNIGFIWCTTLHNLGHRADRARRRNDARDGNAACKHCHATGEHSDAASRHRDSANDAAESDHAGIDEAERSTEQHIPHELNLESKRAAVIGNSEYGHDAQRISVRHVAGGSERDVHWLDHEPVEHNAFDYGSIFAEFVFAESAFANRGKQ
jgi:hypothetical protein